MTSLADVVLMDSRILPPPFRLRSSRGLLAAIPEESTQEPAEAEEPEPRAEEPAPANVAAGEGDDAEGEADGEEEAQRECAAGAGPAADDCRCGREGCAGGA